MTKYVADPKAKRAAKREETRKAREAAFREETDPLIGKVLRGEMTKKEYRARCEKIRERLPYPPE